MTVEDSPERRSIMLQVLSTASSLQVLAGTIDLSDHNHMLAFVQATEACSRDMQSRIIALLDDLDPEYRHMERPNG